MKRTDLTDSLQKTVYTYYAPVSQISSSEQRQQIELCRQSWEKHGWKLTVIGPPQAEQHPWFELYSIGIRALPTVNPPDYDYHCFLRWLAMVSVGGGLMIDYDVMNMGLSDLSVFQQHSLLTVGQLNIPSVVYGTAAQYLTICRRFFQFAVNRLYVELHKSGRSHVSDMIMLKSIKSDELKKLDIVSAYPSTAALIHCSTGVVRSCNETKLQAMQKLWLQLNGSA